LFCALVSGDDKVESREVADEEQTNSIDCQVSTFQAASEAEKSSRTRREHLVSEYFRTPWSLLATTLQRPRKLGDVGKWRPPDRDKLCDVQPRRLVASTRDDDSTGGRKRSSRRRRRERNGRSRPSLVELWNPGPMSNGIKVLLLFPIRGRVAALICC